MLDVVRNLWSASCCCVKEAALVVVGRENVGPSPPAPPSAGLLVESDRRRGKASCWSGETDTDTVSRVSAVVGLPAPGVPPRMVLDMESRLLTDDDEPEDLSFAVEGTLLEEDVVVVLVFSEGKTGRGLGIFTDMGGRVRLRPRVAVLEGDAFFSMALEALATVALREAGVGEGSYASDLD